MPRDSQGMPAHSFGHARRQDEAHKAKMSPSVDPKSRPEGHQPDPDAEMKDESPEDIKDFVQMHGPATEVTHKFDEATGKHHVHSKHGEMSHHSVHESHAAAHAHMGHAMGVSEEEHEPAGEEEPEPQSVGKHHAIPGMGY